MTGELPFAVWGLGLLAVVCLLLCIGWGIRGSRSWAIFYGALAAGLAMASAISAALFAGGFLTP